jgi:hypothetical protein
VAALIVILANDEGGHGNVHLSGSLVLDIIYAITVRRVVIEQRKVAKLNVADGGDPEFAAVRTNATHWHGGSTSLSAIDFNFLQSELVSPARSFLSIFLWFNWHSVNCVRRDFSEQKEAQKQPICYTTSQLFKTSDLFRKTSNL